MRRLNVRVKGLEDAIKGFSVKASKAQGKADRVTESYARKMANDSGDMAPVDTGALRTNIIASPRRIKPALWEYGGTLPYTRRQEYEHRTKKGFIRKSVWNNRNDYREALRREVIDDD